MASEGYNVRNSQLSPQGSGYHPGEGGTPVVEMQNSCTTYRIADSCSTEEINCPKFKQIIFIRLLLLFCGR